MRVIIRAPGGQCGPVLNEQEYLFKRLVYHLPATLERSKPGAKDFGFGQEGGRLDAHAPGGSSDRWLDGQMRCGFVFRSNVDVATLFAPCVQDCCLPEIAVQ